MPTVREEHWRYWLGDMPMPEDATPEMMWAAVDAMDSMKSVEDTLQDLKTFQEMRDNYVRLHENSEASEAVKWYDDILDFYRGKLNG